jgi:tRNA G10  N-methylase Trm11
MDLFMTQNNESKTIFEWTSLVVHNVLTITIKSKDMKKTPDEVIREWADAVHWFTETKQVMTESNRNKIDSISFTVEYQPMAITAFEDKLLDLQNADIVRNIVRDADKDEDGSIIPGVIHVSNGCEAMMYD